MITQHFLYYSLFNFGIQDSQWLKIEMVGSYENAVLLFQGSPNQAKWAKFSSNFELGSKTKLNSPCFLIFESRSFLANNLRFLVKPIDKAIVINGEKNKNKRKAFIQAIYMYKEGLICQDKRITANILTKFQVKIKSQIKKYTNRRFLY